MDDVHAEAPLGAATPPPPPPLRIPVSAFALTQSTPVSAHTTLGVSPPTPSSAATAAEPVAPAVVHAAGPAVGASPAATAATVPTASEAPDVRRALGEMEALRQRMGVLEGALRAGQEARSEEERNEEERSEEAGSTPWRGAASFVDAEPALPEELLVGHVPRVSPLVTAPSPVLMFLGVSPAVAAPPQYGYGSPTPPFHHLSPAPFRHDSPDVLHQPATLAAPQPPQPLYGSPPAVVATPVSQVRVKFEMTGAWRAVADLEARLADVLVDLMSAENSPELMLGALVPVLRAELDDCQRQLAAAQAAAVTEDPTAVDRVEQRRIFNARHDVIARVASRGVLGAQPDLLRALVASQVELRGYIITH
jgi:hypothetical protein